MPFLKPSDSKNLVPLRPRRVLSILLSTVLVVVLVSPLRARVSRRVHWTKRLDVVKRIGEVLELALIGHRLRHAQLDEGENGGVGGHETATQPVSTRKHEKSVNLVIVPDGHSKSDNSPSKNTARRQRAAQGTHFRSNHLRKVDDSAPKSNLEGVEDQVRLAAIEAGKFAGMFRQKLVADDDDRLAALQTHY